MAESLLILDVKRNASTMGCQLAGPLPQRL